MHDNLGEQLTVDDIARAAMFSKFHFTRIFQRATGIPPGRFLSALRLQRAKQLLVATELNVADISQQVGYNSVGTFSSRFSRSVGMSPTTYRRLAGFAPHISAEAADEDAPDTAAVRGHILPHTGDEARLAFIGLFPGRIPQGRPVRCAVLPHAGPFTLDRVPPGTWYLLAQSVPGRLDHPDGYQANVSEAVSVATRGPLDISAGSVVHVDIEFSPVKAVDPPVLLAMLDVRNVAVAIVAAAQAEATAAVSTIPPAPPVVDQRRTSDRHAA
jgi:AraC-like DNA-binding protein